jgi:hypothetical protein
LSNLYTEPRNIKKTRHNKESATIGVEEVEGGGIATVENVETVEDAPLLLKETAAADNQDPVVEVEESAIVESEKVVETAEFQIREGAAVEDDEEAKQHSFEENVTVKIHDVAIIEDEGGKDAKQQSFEENVTVKVHDVAIIEDEEGEESKQQSFEENVTVKVHDVAIIEDEEGEESKQQSFEENVTVKVHDVAIIEDEEGEESKQRSFEENVTVKVHDVAIIEDEEGGDVEGEDDERAILEAEEAAAVEAARKIATLDKFRQAHALVSRVSMDRRLKAEDSMRALYSLPDGAPTKPIPDTPEFAAYRASLFAIIDSLDHTRDGVVEIVRPRCNGIMRGEVLRLDAFKSRLVSLRAKRSTLGVPAEIIWTSRRL